MPKSQVALSRLLFTHSWEDPQSDRVALAPLTGMRVVAITSGGCNVLSLLIDDPARIHAIDINPAQSALLVLKIAAIRALDLTSYRSFLGIDPAHDRWATYLELEPALSPAAAAF